MRMHTTVLKRQDFIDALAGEQMAGRIAPTVEFKCLSEHGSRSGARAFEVQLSSWGQVKGDGRRRGNDGAWGAMQDAWAATHDEWGFVLAALYRLDPTMVCGSAKHPVYADQDDYRCKTGWTYELDALIPLLEAGNDPYPYRPARGYRIGRRGANRASVQDLAGRPHWASSYYTWEPRTPESYRCFARLEV